MKQIFTLLVGALLFIGVNFAYTPNNADIQAINQLNTQLDIITSGNMQGKAKLYIQLKNLQEQFSGHEKLQHYLNSMDNHLMAHINIEKTKAKAESKVGKQAFVDTYSGDIIPEIDSPDSCTGRYNTLDSISFANNFPTAMTIATRFRETTCGYYLPNNGDGPFQILSKDYGTGAITEGKFLTTIQDFIDFSKSKHGAHYSKIGPIFTYTGFTMTGLVNHAALYNGGTLTGSVESGYTIRPNAPKYVYDGYGNAYSGATRYGVIPKFIKVLDWEIKNTY